MTLSPAHRITQLALFDDRATVPGWNVLNEPVRSDVIKLLAQLLISVRTSKLIRTPRKQGERDE